MTTVVPKLLARWLVRSTLLVLLVSALTFVLVSLTPGDPARTILGQSATQEQYEALRLQMGLDEPLLTRYGAWLADAVHGDLGASLFSGEAVTSLIGQRLGVTLTLIAGGVLAAGLLGVALGVVSARSTGLLARVVDVASLVGSAIPPFWLGLVLSAVFAVGLRLVPVVGYTSPAVDPAAWFLSILLPVTTLALAGTAIVAKQTRDAMRDELSKDYVLVLRSHGASERTVQIKHALRNAGVPVVTVLGVLLIGLLGGTVLVESVFSLPGLGGLAVTSTLRHDLPVIQGVTVLFTVVVVAVNLLVDLLNTWINPKVSA